MVLKQQGYLLCSRPTLYFFHDQAYPAIFFFPHVVFQEFTAGPVLNLLLFRGQNGISRVRGNWSMPYTRNFIQFCTNLEFRLQNFKI